MLEEKQISYRKNVENVPLERAKSNWIWKTNTVVHIIVGRIVKSDPRVTRNNEIVSFLSLKSAAP